MESEEYYAEADEMSPGWGKYLRSIDLLREKYDADAELSLNEACWILWAQEFVPSGRYLAWKASVDKYKNHELPWAAWLGMYREWERRQAKNA